MGTKVSTIKKGDRFWCVHRQLGTPKLGSVICLTSQIGKTIGIEFDDELSESLSNIDCDGRGKKGYCMWVHQDFLYNEKEYKEMVKKNNAERKALKNESKDLEEIVIK